MKPPLILLIITLFLYLSCRTQPDSGDQFLYIKSKCRYIVFHGRAEIHSVSQIDEVNAKIVFSFKLKAESDRERYKFPNFPDESQERTVPVTIVQGWKLKTGDIIECVRCEIVSGTCTPVVFKFPGLEEVIFTRDEGEK